MDSREKEAICILLATYNGKRFLSEQLDSLLSQSYTSWELFVRDDGSTDGTIQIINRYLAKDTRIHLIPNGEKNSGSCQNFAQLLLLTANDFNYFMFCDQDDVWLPNKIGETYALMRELEELNSHSAPILVYTNFTYVYSNLETIQSKKNFETTKVGTIKFAHLLAQNPIYGCTMLFNKPLAKIIGHIPMQAENHDYWTALVASAFGKIGYLKTPAILYRQHNSNISTNYDSSSTAKRFKRIFLERKNLKDVEKKLIMATTFRDKYQQKLTKEQQVVLENFLGLFKHKSPTAFVKNIRNGVRRQTLLQTILFYVSIFLLRKNQLKNN